MTELAEAVNSEDVGADDRDVTLATVQPSPTRPEPTRPDPTRPDRADAPVSEVTERFLRAVIDKVPLERIEELHLFAPLRQGGTETGIAVVAARVPVPTPGDELPDSASAPVVRHTVYTARYRLILKGPERGTWEADVVDEADAPLLTVEMVVRGVQRRAGEDTEILRYSDRQIARALRVEWPLPTA